MEFKTQRKPNIKARTQAKPEASVAQAPMFMVESTSQG